MRPRPVRSWLTGGALGILIGLCGLNAVARAAGLRGAAGIGWVVRQEIARGEVPGAVVLIGDRNHILYERAFGYRSFAPRERMTVDTIFDLASLTKVVATTPAIMRLIAAGRLSLDAPVARYWPAFAAHGKSRITVRELLMHTSGLAPDLPLTRQWTGRAAALRRVVAERPVARPGSRYLYSDINFIVLGELVRRVSGLPLEVYCRRYIFRPLGMRHTFFRPPRAVRGNIAPTELIGGRLLQGVVQDPTAERMGGVAGHAGLFSSAVDLARYAQALMRDGRISATGARRILRPSIVRLMRQPEQVATDRYRGLGWDMAAPFVAGRSSLPPFGAYGHLGYTGTSLWIDPVRGLFLIVLTSRLYPEGRGDAQPLRHALTDLLSVKAPARAATDPVSGSAPVHAVHDPQGAEGGRVLTGAEVLEADGFAELRGLRIGLITNQSGRALVPRLAHAPGVRLVALFSPEHGIEGRLDAPVGNSVDARTGLPVYSLYGRHLRPTSQMLRGLDALVFDVQDSGTRFFTFATTMAYAMQAAARHGLRFIVLDRPDPIDSRIVEGPMLSASLRSFTGFYPMPLRPGMTLGEIARLFNSQAHIGVRLTVIRMRGYRRSEWLDETGLPWVRPSPNLRSLEEETLYPGVGMLEGANVSVGRGTDTPFQVLGAPWIDGDRLARYLAHRDVPGVVFVPVRFVPAASRYKGRSCQGVRILLASRRALRSGLLGVELLSALHRLYPQRFDLRATLALVGSRSVLAGILAGEDPRAIARGWRAPVRTFLALRRRYLLYPR